jgi:hypothetical protein
VASRNPSLVGPKSGFFLRGECGAHTDTTPPPPPPTTPPPEKDGEIFMDNLSTCLLSLCEGSAKNWEKQTRPISSTDIVVSTLEEGRCFSNFPFNTDSMRETAVLADAPEDALDQV